MAKIVVMGVAGCGKSTLGAALAAALGCEFVEGDKYHSPSSQAKMSKGIGLDDGDRLPWLARLGGLMAAREGDVVLSCSALKRAYREQLRAAVAGLLFVYVEIDEATAAERVGARPTHFFPADLVAAQFEALESPIGEKGVLAVSAHTASDAQLAAIMRWLDAEA
jgi:gluconokinase